MHSSADLSPFCHSTELSPAERDPETVILSSMGSGFGRCSYVCAAFVRLHLDDLTWLSRLLWRALRKVFYPAEAPLHVPIRLDPILTPKYNTLRRCRDGGASLKGSPSKGTSLAAGLVCPPHQLPQDILEIYGVVLSLE